ncbi:MAG: hypothetical protein H7177_06825 [Rhizobacter sp.]|nr:hypothetical protein [Bacteriovorax sp.]
MIKYLLLAIFFSRIVLSFTNYWSSWLPLTWWISPTGGMFTLPTNTSVNTKYLLKITGKNSREYDLQKETTTNFLYQNQTASNLILLMTKTPVDSYVNSRAIQGFKRLICHSTEIKAEENFVLEISEFQAVHFKKEFKCD